MGIGVAFSGVWLIAGCKSAFIRVIRVPVLFAVYLLQQNAKSAGTQKLRKKTAKMQETKAAPLFPVFSVVSVV